MIDLLLQDNRSCLLFRIIRFFISIIWCVGIVHSFFKRSAKLTTMTESKFQIVRPSGMPRNDLDPRLSLFQICFQFFQRLNGDFIAFGQGTDKAVAAVSSEPDRVTGKKIFIINQVDHVAPCMPGHQDTLNLDPMQEALKCSQNHIELTVVADGKLLSFIRSVDLYTMLSNILDNAVEANLRIEDPARRAIHLSVHEKKGLVILQCENPYEGRITMRDGLPETVKADKENHGIGTRSISATAAAYGGVVRIDPRDGMYVLRIIFQPPNTSQDEKTTT